MLDRAEWRWQSVTYVCSDRFRLCVCARACISVQMQTADMIDSGDAGCLCVWQWTQQGRPSRPGFKQKALFWGRNLSSAAYVGTGIKGGDGMWSHTCFLACGLLKMSLITLSIQKVSVWFQLILHYYLYFYSSVILLLLKEVVVNSISAYGQTGV